MSRRAPKRRVAVSDDDEAADIQSPAKRGRIATSSGNESEEEANGTAKARVLDKGKGRAAQDEVMEDEDDEEESGEEEEEEEEEEEDNAEEVPAERPVEILRPELERGDDGYVVGAVTRIKLKNFMTYDFVEFRPGPRLNMILGPNGTGKSSIAAAIAIGLGFSPNIMGRAPNLQAYVKQGTEHAETEIELKAPRGKSNYVITRKFQMGNEKSTWQLNGKSKTKKDIEQLVTKLGVQANNLCSFLPQDKVAEFARMNPVDVLRETMRSAGDSRLTEWHAQLSESGKEKKVMDEELNRDVQQRDNIAVQVAELEPDIRNYERRQDLERELKITQLRLLAAQAEHARNETLLFNDELIQKRAIADAITNQVKPLEHLKKRQQSQLDYAENKTKRAAERLTENERPMAKAGDKARKAAAAGSSLQAELDEIHAKKKSRLRRIQQAEDKIKSLEAQLEEPEVDVQADLTAKKADLPASSKKRRDLEREQQTLESSLRALDDDAAGCRRDIDDRNARKAEMSNAYNQRCKQAFKLDPSIQYAVEWIEQHQMEFEAKVHYPPMISVNVPDPRYAWQVEATTNIGTRKTFICENQADYVKLMSLNKRNVVVDGKPIKVDLWLGTIQVSEESANPRRPCSRETLAQLGFDGFVVDFIDAEAPVIAYLCRNSNFHQTAVTLREGSSIDADKAVDAGIMQWHTSTDSNMARRSAYGNRDVNITTSEPILPRAFHLSVDKEAIKKIEDEVAQSKRKLKELEQPMGKVNAQLGSVKQQLEEAVEEHDGLKAQISRLQMLLNKRQMAHVTLENAQANLRRAQAEPDPESKRGDLKAELLEHVLERRKQLCTLSQSYEDAVNGIHHYTKVAMAQSQAAANVAAIEEAIVASAKRGDAVNEDIAKLIPTTKKWRNLKAVLLKRLGDLVAMENDPEITEMFIGDDITFPSIDEVQNQLANIQAQLEASVGVSAEAVQRHQRLSKQLDDKKAIVSQLQRRLATMDARIDKIRRQFDPALNVLVEEASVKFSEAFARLRCSGQLEVNREGDYADWGINIQVAFRDGEALETLKMHRHSGGERSLATVTYLMSLSAMSRTPFSLVDEINQGMDARAERNVHNSMVSVTCDENVGQYFLITPKLLTGLDYHPNMKILIVNNGPWVPKSATGVLSYGSLGSCLNKYKQHHAITA